MSNLCSDLLTTHEVVDHRIDGTVGVAEPMREQREHGHHLILANVYRVSAGRGFTYGVESEVMEW